jgi:hypothetical protein
MSLTISSDVVNDTLDVVHGIWDMADDISSVVGDI